MNTPAHNSPWFQQSAMTKFNRRMASKPSAHAGDTFLIVTEGHVTEPVYFNLLRKKLQLKAVTVKIQPSWAPDPRHVINAAADMVKDLAQRAKRNELAIDEAEKFDHVWAVIDTDVAMRHRFWPDVVRLAKSKKVKLAHSTPCFEFWLLLHFGYTIRTDLINGTEAKKAIEAALEEPYSTNEAATRAIMPRFMETWPDAVLNAEQVRAHHRTAGAQAPANPSTEVDRLVRALNDAALPHYRRL